ncbi:MAG: fumarylacetoacetate hydrolase family protein [Sulfolobus sp.]|nr:fumarylacetoacetate hydrolase family protein [Sulfolobus sp.]
MVKFVRFSIHGGVKLGVVEGDNIFEIEDYAYKEPKGESYKIEEIKFELPIEPRAIICTLVNSPNVVGVTDKEEARAMVGSPKFFLKLPTVAIPHKGIIISPKDAIRPEVEIGIVLKKRLKNASVSEVKDAILGYTVFNDVTYPPGIKQDSYYAMRMDPIDGKVKKLYIRGSHFRNKVRDSFAPIGPWIVTPEEIDDIYSLKMRSYYDNKLVQEGNSSEFIFSIEEILIELSKIITIPELSIISTGSIGYIGVEEVSEFSLIPRDGALMVAEVEKIGRLENITKIEV